MSSTIVKKENNEVTLKIEVSAEAFEQGVQKAYNKMKGKFNIPGFRKGKAPRKIIELQYGEGIFFEEAFNQIFPDAYEQAIKDNNLDPVDKPMIDVESMGKGEALVFTATVTVVPEVTLGAYKGIEVSKKEYNVEEAEVEAEIEKLRERNARLISVERPVKEGDTVVIDYAGFVGDEQFEGGTAEKQPLVIGSGQFIPGFEEQLVGVEIGKEVDVKVTFPTEYHAPDLAGKEAVFKVTVHEVKEKEVPALDDEFAKDVSEFDTLEELKADTKHKLEENAKKREQREFRDAVVDKVIENVQVEIPEIMVEHQLDDMLGEVNYQLQFQGLNLETYLKYMNQSEADMRNQMRDDAYTRVKTQLTLEEIAKQENVEATPEDLDAELEKYAAQYKQELEKFKTSLRSSDLEQIKEGIKVRKTVDLLVNEAKIVE